MNKLICITGMPGSGKSTTSDYILDKKDYKYIRFGQVVLDEVKRRSLSVNEKNERKVREDLRKKHGMAAMAKLNLDKFKNLLKENHTVADGLYSLEEYKLLKEEFENLLVVIAVYSPPAIRYERLTKRKHDKKDKNARFRPLTKKQAVSRDYAELENLNKGGTIAMADFTVVNNKNLSYLYRQVDNVLEEIEKEE